MAHTTFKAKELGRRVGGMSRQALHQYLLAGVLEPVGRTPGGQWLYDETSVARVLLVKKFLKHGETLLTLRNYPWPAHTTPSPETFIPAPRIIEAGDPNDNTNQTHQTQGGPVVVQNEERAADEKPPEG